MLSIILPTKRGADLKTCLYSIKKHTKDYEVILIDRVAGFNGEFYNAPVYNYLIKDGLKVTIHEIPINKVHLLGTPKELEEYVNLHN